MVRFILHYGIHFLVPILIGFYFFRDSRIKITLILLAGILIDLDHFLASPIYDSDRCSINFHPLHSYWAILVYCLLPFYKPTRIIGLALIIHIVADIADCLFLEA